MEGFALTKLVKRGLGWSQLYWLGFLLDSAIHLKTPEPWVFSPVVATTAYLAELTSEGSIAQWHMQSMRCVLLLLPPFPEEWKKKTQLLLQCFGLC